MTIEFLADTDSVYCRRSNAPIVDTDSGKAVDSTEKVALKRHLGLPSGVCFIIGIIIGKDGKMFMNSIEMIFCIRFGNICFSQRCPT